MLDSRIIEVIIKNHIYRYIKIVNNELYGSKWVGKIPCDMKGRGRGTDVGGQRSDVGSQRAEDGDWACGRWGLEDRELRSLKVGGGTKSGGGHTADGGERRTGGKPMEETR
jgi:hypothetical protein